jgi:choline dehydrogenase-like flavoprotein
MGMFRPSKAEVDALEDLGIQGWDWDSLLPYFKKVRNAALKIWLSIE